MTNFILCLIALLIALLLGAQFLPEHWAHVARFGFAILVACGVLFLALIHFSVAWQSEKKKLEEILEASRQQEESQAAQTHTSGNTGDDGEALEPVYRLDAVTGEMREIRPGKYVPGPVKLEIKTDE